MADKKGTQTIIRVDGRKPANISTRPQIILNPYSDYSSNYSQLDKVAQKHGRQVFSEMMENYKIAAQMRARINKVLGREWKIDAAKTDKPEAIKKADWIKEAFKRLEFNKAREDYLTMIWAGFALFEIIGEEKPYEDQGWRGFWGIKKLRSLPAEKFDIQQDKVGNIEGVRINSMWGTSGQTYPYEKFLHAIYAQQYDSPYGKSVLAPLYIPYYILKNGLLQFSYLAEKTSIPHYSVEETGAVPSLPYGSEAYNLQMKDILNFLDNIQAKTGFIPPPGFTIKILEASQAGAITHETLNRICADAIAEGITGQDTSSKTSQFAKSQEIKASNDVKEDYTNFDLSLLAQEINKKNGLIHLLQDMNFSDGVDYPIFSFIAIDKETPEQKIARANLIADKKLDVKKEEYYKLVNMSIPADGDDVMEWREAPAFTSGLIKEEGKEEDETPGTDNGKD